MGAGWGQDLCCAHGCFAEHLFCARGRQLLHLKLHLAAALNAEKHTCCLWGTTDAQGSQDEMFLVALCAACTAACSAYRDVKRLDRRDAHKYRNSKAKTKSAKVSQHEHQVVLVYQRLIKSWPEHHEATNALRLVLLFFHVLIKCIMLVTASSSYTSTAQLAHMQTCCCLCCAGQACWPEGLERHSRRSGRWQRGHIQLSRPCMGAGHPAASLAIWQCSM